jgi:hypothetical protein
MTDEHTTDVDGRPVQPVVSEMAESLAAPNGVYDVQISRWKSSRIQLWATGQQVPQSVHNVIADSGWRTAHSESRALAGAERGYVELVPQNFDPTAFPGSA